MAASPSEGAPSDLAPSEAVQVGLIWAQARGGVIGAAGGLPWDLPEDLAHFAATTRGRPVVMGRRTWESLPARVRPLPGRANVVLSRDPDLDAPGAEVAPTLADALGTAGPGRCWVIGGASVYAAAGPVADLAVVTEIDADVPGDTWAPGLGDGWTGDDPGWAVSRTGLRYRVRTLRRERGPAAGPH